jgi:DNA-directed RNA polymerase specialized sigma24 family protein
VRHRDRFEGLEAFLAERGDALLATAALLVGEQPAGEDLLQTALERLMRNWHRVTGDPEGYLRRTMYHLAVDQWRGRRRRPEVLTEVEWFGNPDATAEFDQRHALV